MGGCVSKKETRQQNGKPAPNNTPAPINTSKPSRTSSKTTTILGKGLQDVSEFYTLGKVLGRGQFGTTRLAEDKKTGKQYACKSIAKRKLTCTEDIEDVRREIQIMHHLKGHPNITYLKMACEDRQAVHLVMDLCSGGELFDKIVAKGHYSEKDAATLIRTVVSVVAHCHNLGVMHRDLKPENFLLESKADNAGLKCTDFGLSVFFKEGQAFSEVVGSAYYVAPEVLKRRYGPEADIWSCGVIAYILLSGVPPFWGETEQGIFDAVLKGKIDFESDPWPKISTEAKDCIKRLLHPEPKKRATAKDILSHPWMKENGMASDQPLDNVILKRMRNFANMNKLKKEAMKVIAAGMPVEEIAGLKALFQSIDTDKSGTITVEELKESMNRKGSFLKEADLHNLMAMIDIDANGSIDYDEFLAATMSIHQMEKEENMMRAFQHFDTDSSGTITSDELREGLKAAGAIDDEEIEQIIKEADSDGNGEIDYAEFVAMMTKQQEVVSLKAQKSKARGNINGYKAAHN